MWCFVGVASAKAGEGSLFDSIKLKLFSWKQCREVVWLASVVYFVEQKGCVVRGLG